MQWAWEIQLVQKETYIAISKQSRISLNLITCKNIRDIRVKVLWHDVSWSLSCIPPKILVDTLQREFHIIIEVKSPQLYLYFMFVGNFTDSTEINLLGKGFKNHLMEWNWHCCWAKLIFLIGYGNNWIFCTVQSLVRPKMSIQILFFRNMRLKSYRKILDSKRLPC